MTQMIPNVLSNLMHQPKTRLYPFEARLVPVGTRGQIDFNMEKCIFCTLCEKRCPSDAIKVDRKGKTLTFDPLRCIVCEACVEGCAKDAIEMHKQWRAPVSERYTKVYKSVEKEEAQEESE